MPERCVASTFLSFRNYLQSRQYKNHECQQSFFLLPLSPPFSFLSRVVSRLMGVQKSGFGVVPAKVGKSSGATFSKIQVDIASNCCQMAKNDRILADERPLQHFLAILAHFMPIYTRIFENGTARLRCPSGVSRALFCRSETISKVGNIKIMSANSPFFFSLSPLPSLFSPVWFLGSWESKKSGFGVVPAKVGKSSGATFSKIQVDIASNCCQMAKNDRILADERPLQHFLAILAHFMPIYTRIFENGTARLWCPSGVSRALFCRSETISKVGNIKIMSASSPFFFSPLSPPFSFLSRVVSRLMGVQKSGFGVVPAKVGKSSGATFSKIQVDIASNCCQMAPKPDFLDSHEPRNHTGEKREGRGERGEEKRTVGTHDFYIAYFGDSF